MNDNEPKYLTACLIDDLDTQLYGKSVMFAVDTYAAYALSSVYTKDYDKAKQYLEQLRRCIAGNADIHLNE